MAWLVFVLTMAALGASAGDAGVDWRISHPGGTNGYAEIRIGPGESVTWTNGDSFHHDVVVTRGGAIIARSSLFGSGESYSHRINEAGTYQYYCSIPGHNGTMYGRIVVGTPTAPSTDMLPILLAVTAVILAAVVATLVFRRREKLK